MNSKNRIKLIRSLKQRKYRQKYNKFVCEGAKITREVLLHHRDHVSEGYGTRAFLESLEPSLASQLVEVSRIDLKQMSSLESNQDAILVCEMPQAVPQRSLDGMSFYLDGIRDPGNMGTIMRICDWFGLEDLFLSPDCVDIYNPKVVQASMGSLFRVHTTIVPQQQIPDLLKDKARILVADMKGQDYREIKLEKPVMIVLGNEANGPSVDVLSLDHDVVSIPRAAESAAESLNVAIAVGILASRFA